MRCPRPCPTTAPLHSEMREQRRRRPQRVLLPSHPAPATPAPDSFTNLHAAACAVCCVAGKVYTTSSPFAAPRNAPTRPLHILAAAHASALLAYATAHARLCAMWHTQHHPNTHCLHRFVGARVPPPAFCPRAHACTLPRLRRRRWASRSQQSHAMAVRRSLCHTHNTCPHAPLVTHRRGGGSKRIPI